MRPRSAITSKPFPRFDVNRPQSSQRAGILPILMSLGCLLAKAETTVPVNRDNSLFGSQNILTPSLRTGVWASALGNTPLTGMSVAKNTTDSDSYARVAEHPFQGIPEDWPPGLPVIRWGALPWSWYLDQQVIPDSEPPDLILLGANPMAIALGTPDLEPGATATDAVDGLLDSAIRISGTVDTTAAGEYRLVYEVSEAQGNRATRIRRVIVEASEPPTPPRIRFGSSVASGSVVLEMLAPMGTTLILETGTRLGDWTEFQRLPALGENTPVRVNLSINSSEEARFWRVRRL